MRQRYTILTVVDSATEYEPTDSATDPPHVFVLFKGTPNGFVQKSLEALDRPKWLHVQVQEQGSYREVDVKNSLRKLLPVALKPEDSMVIMLDWFAAHRTSNVIKFIEDRGHVVLFHGGGCTPFTQVNDTHLHAVLQRTLVKLENHIMHGKRVDMHMNNQAGVPSLSREDIINIVATAWKMQPHKTLTAKGYEQTGPLMPKSGSIRRDQVYKDLRKVWDSIDPPQGDQEMGQKMRDDAQAFVERGFGSKWSKWSDVKSLIQEHDDGDDPIPEGLELATWDTTRGDSDEEDDQQDGDDGDHDDGHVADNADNADEVIAVSDGDDADDHDAVALDGADVHGFCDSVGDSVGCGVADLTVTKARDVLIEDYKKKGNEGMLKRLYSDKRGETATEAIKLTEASDILQQNHEAELLKMTTARANAKKTKLTIIRDTEQAAQSKAESQERAAKLRNDELDKQLRQWDLAQREKKIAHDQKIKDQWIAIHFPLSTVRKLLKHFETPEVKSAFVKLVKERAAKNDFMCNALYCADHLWKVYDSDMVIIGSVSPYRGFRIGAPRSVRCTPAFLNHLEDYVDGCSQKSHKGNRDILQTLTSLLQLTMPGAFQDILGGRDRIHQILHMCEYVLDKAFVLCVIQVSKKFMEPAQQLQFPAGIFKYPPHVPTAVLNHADRSFVGVPGTIFQGTASSSASASVAGS